MPDPSGSGVGSSGAARAPHPISEQPPANGGTSCFAHAHPHCGRDLVSVNTIRRVDASGLTRPARETRAHARSMTLSASRSKARVGSPRARTQPSPARRSPRWRLECGDDRGTLGVEISTHSKATRTVAARTPCLPRSVGSRCRRLLISASSASVQRPYCLHVPRSRASAPWARQEAPYLVSRHAVRRSRETAPPPTTAIRRRFVAGRARRRPRRRCPPPRRTTTSGARGLRNRQRHRGVPGSMQDHRRLLISRA